MSPEIAVPIDTDAALVAFLKVKEQRSGSLATFNSYRSRLEAFFSYCAERNTPLTRVTSGLVEGWAHSVGPSGREPSRNTIAARLYAVRSFYRFLKAHGAVDDNPVEEVAAPKREEPTIKGLSPDELHRLLSACPGTCAGVRDRAIILALVYTGRRRSEILNLRVGDLTRNHSKVYYTYRGKGGLRKTRELPPPCFKAIVSALAACGQDLELMGPEEPLFDLSLQGAYLSLRARFKRAGLPFSGVHTLRHTAAKLRRDAGESVEQVSSFLDHADLAITSTYLRRLEGEDDDGWPSIAALLDRHDSGHSGSGTPEEPQENAIESGLRKGDDNGLLSLR